MFNNSTAQVATTKQAAQSETDQSWVGFLCEECGAPLAVHRSNNGSRPGERSFRGWRITCISCGVPHFYELGSAMVRIAAT
jgi:RNase P subunit RPR2